MSSSIRVMTVADIPAGMRLKEVAGWNQTRGDWERFLIASPGGCFVAEVAGAVVGTVTTLAYEGRFAWIGMVLVHPAHRGQGIGKALLIQAIDYLDGRGIPSIKLDATPQGQILYEKLGFVSEYAIERWELTRAEASFRGRELSGVGSESPVGDGALTEELLAMDREVFGAGRNALLQSVALEHPAFFLRTRSEGRLTGYCLGRQGTRADHLGPWVTQDELSAGELLEEFLHRSRAARVFVDGVIPNPWAMKLLGAHGFQYSRSLTRMYRGRNEFPGSPALQGAILGPEFG